MSRLLAGPFALALTLLLSTCDEPVGSTLGTGSELETEEPQFVRLSTSSVILNTPESSAQLLATVRYEAHQLVNPGGTVWTSFDPSVATVSAGLVTAQHPGSTLITARFGSKVDTVRVTVANVRNLGEDLDDDQFSFIPAGSFVMGGGIYQPVHQVRLTKGFFLLKTEVTRAQWVQVMGGDATGSEGCASLCPVDLVSWEGVQDFLALLNDAHPGRNYRLPTEAEWEYAARAGVAGDDWDLTNLETVAWWSGNSGGAVHGVALKAPNLFGLHDVLGNAMEFTADFYSPFYYAVSPQDDPLGPTNGLAADGRRVIRGGSCTTVERYMGFWIRGQMYPFLPGRAVGFRIAADDWTGS